MALLYGSMELEDIKGKSMSFDQKIGVDIVQKALLMPLKDHRQQCGCAARASPALMRCASRCTLVLSRKVRALSLRSLRALGRSSTFLRTSAVRAATRPMTCLEHPESYDVCSSFA